MRKLLIFATLVALTLGCAESNLSDVSLSEDLSNGYVGDVVAVEVAVEGATRVTVTGDVAAQKSEVLWQEGDQITLVHNGRLYKYVATQSAAQALFMPLSDSDALRLKDVKNRGIAVYYNVKSIDTHTMSATFDVAPLQQEGELSNKLPLYGYCETPNLDNTNLKLILKPLASIVEVEVKASRSWTVDALSIGCAVGSSDRYAVATDVVVDAATGHLNFRCATLVDEVAVKLASACDIATPRKVQFVVMGATVGGQMPCAPIYYGKTVLKSYKGGVENARKTIWSSYSLPKDAVCESKHIYQPTSDILQCKVADGISTAEQMAAFANAVNGSEEPYPAGVEFSNEDGVVVLKNSISLSQYADWAGVGRSAVGDDSFNHGFAGVFDGGGNTISGLAMTAREDAGLFVSLAEGGVVKNLTVEGEIVIDAPKQSGHLISVGGVVAAMSGGRVENCTNRVLFKAAESLAGGFAVGGIVGKITATTADAVVTGCQNEKDINLLCSSQYMGRALIGGIVGHISDSSRKFSPTVERCSNGVGISLFNAGSGSTIGGIAGTVSCNSGKQGVVSECVNSGAISGGSNQESCEALFIGGIAGRHSGHNLSACTNSGTISISEQTTAPLGPCLGGITGFMNSDYDVEIAAQGCVNSGQVSVEGVASITRDLCVGGMVGSMRGCCLLESCQSSGAVTVDVSKTKADISVGGVVGTAGENVAGYKGGIAISGCSYSGSVTAKNSATSRGWSNIGGVVGSCYGGDESPKSGSFGLCLTGCNSSGTVAVISGSRVHIGGVAGLINSSAIERCTHTGVVALERQTTTSDILGGIAGQVDNSHTMIDGCNNFGTICNLVPTAYESRAGASNIYVLLGGIMGSGGGADVAISNCISAGKLLTTHNRLMDYDEWEQSWIINKDVTTEYRGAIAGNINKNQIVTKCSVGGSVGVVKGGDGDDKYSATEQHDLVDVEGDDYYWRRWLHGYKNVPTYSRMSFYK